MKKLLLIVVLLFLTAIAASAQTTSVSLNVTDASDQIWFNGTWTAKLTAQSGTPPNQYYIINTTTPVPNQQQAGSLDASGDASLTVTPNASIAPANSIWEFNVCALATYACYTQRVVISGSSQSVNLIPPAIAINMQHPPLAVAVYNNSEPYAQGVGQTIYNLTNQFYYVWGNNTWNPLCYQGTTCGGTAQAGPSQAPLTVFYGGSPTSTVNGQQIWKVPQATVNGVTTNQFSFLPQPANWYLQGPYQTGANAVIVQRAFCNPPDFTDEPGPYTETCTLPNVTSGVTNDGILVVYTANEGGLSSITDDHSNTLTTASHQDQQVDTWLGWEFGIASGIKTITLNFTSGTNGATGQSLFVYEEKGITALDGSVTATGGTSETTLSTTVGAAASNDLLLSIGLNGDSGTSLGCPDLHFPSQTSPFQQFDKQCVINGDTEYFTTLIETTASGAPGTYGATGIYGPTAGGGDQGIMLGAFETQVTMPTAPPSFKPNLFSIFYPLIYQNGSFQCPTCLSGYPGAGIVQSTGSGWGTSLGETDGDILFGLSGLWMKGTALPNGITATTQTTGDNTTKVATDAFVLANVGSGAVSSVTGTSPIVVSPTTGATVVSCPTCSTGGSLAPAPAQMALMGPATVPNTSVGISQVATCTATGSSFTWQPCVFAATLPVGAHVWVAVGASAETCAMSDSFANTWTSEIPNGQGSCLFYSVLTTGGAGDIFTPGSGMSPTSYGATFTILQTTGDAGFDNYAIFGPDSCGTFSTPCTAPVTNTYAYDADIVIATSLATGGGEPSALSISPQTTIVAQNASADPAWQVDLVGEANPGSYTFTKYCGSGTASCGHQEFVFSIKEASPFGTLAETTAAAGSNITSLTIGAVSVGQFWAIGIQTLDLNIPTSCAVNDTGSNVITLRSPTGVFLGFQMYVTTAESSDVLTFNSNCATSSSGKATIAWAVPVAGGTSVETTGVNASGGGPSMGWVTQNPNDALIGGYVDTSGTATIVMSPLFPYVISSSSATTPSWNISGATIPNPSSSSFSGTGISNSNPFYVAIQVTAPVYTPEPRQQVATDPAMFQVQGYDVPFSATNLIYRGDLARSFKVTLTANNTASNVYEFTPGTPYWFRWCQGSGGPYTAAAPTNINVTNWPTLSATGCTVASAMFDGATATLQFLPSSNSILASGTVTLGTSAISSAACASVVTVSASDVATTDSIQWSFNADPTSTTGYDPGAMLTIIVYPTAGYVNFKVCNNTANSITPGVVTLNWRVAR